MNSPRRTLLVTALALGAALTCGGDPAAARPLTREFALSSTIKYYRIRSVPQDLPVSAAAPGEAAILDLRYARGDQAAAGVFGAWMRARAGTRNPVVVLANAETAPMLLNTLSPGLLPPGVVSLGPRSERFSPDIAIDVSAAADRSSYDLLDQGTAIADLVSPRNDKPRRDEASIAKERPGAAADAAESPATRPQPADAVLQRAYQLVRALAALRRF